MVTTHSNLTVIRLVGLCECSCDSYCAYCCLSLFCIWLAGILINNKIIWGSNGLFIAALVLHVITYILWCLSWITLYLLIVARKSVEHNRKSIFSVCLVSIDLNRVALKMSPELVLMFYTVKTTFQKYPELFNVHMWFHCYASSETPFLDESTEIWRLTKLHHRKLLLHMLHRNGDLEYVQTQVHVVYNN